MDDFVVAYLLALVVGGIAFVGFWGAVIFFAIKFVNANNGMSRDQKLRIASGLMRAYTGGVGSNEPGPREMDARIAAADAGIDLERR